MSVHESRPPYGGIMIIPLSPMYALSEQRRAKANESSAIKISRGKAFLGLISPRSCRTDVAIVHFKAIYTYKSYYFLP